MGDADPVARHSASRKPEDLYLHHHRARHARVLDRRHVGAERAPRLHLGLLRQRAIDLVQSSPLVGAGTYLLPVFGELADLARAFPDTTIILDHVGGVLGVGPYEGKRDEHFAQWKAGILDAASCPNVSVKLGGLAMHTVGFGFEHRETPAGSEELAEAWRPYIETCIEAFGADRAMFESNYPVDGVTCSYVVLWNALKRLGAGASEQPARRKSKCGVSGSSSR
mgnify:CR=1 FL=1